MAEEIHARKNALRVGHFNHFLECRKIKVWRFAGAPGNFLEFQSYPGGTGGSEELLRDPRRSQSCLPSDVFRFIEIEEHDSENVRSLKQPVPLPKSEKCRADVILNRHAAKPQ